MADVGGNSSGRSHERYIPSYDAPTAPIPAIPAEDGSIISPRVPRRFPIGDGEEAVLVPRPNHTGSFLSPVSEPASPAWSPQDADPPFWSPRGATESSVGDGNAKKTDSSGGRGVSGRLMARIGDIPIRMAYSLGAALLTALAVILIFTLFSGDEPANQPAPQAERQAAAPKPTVAPIKLPSLPKVTALTAMPGTPSPILGAVTDTKSAITYSMLGSPWAAKAVPLFSVGQRVSTTRLPRTMI